MTDRETSDVKRKIEVMTAYLRGEPIEFKQRESSVGADHLTVIWRSCPSPLWDWVSFNYRMAVEPSPLLPSNIKLGTTLFRRNENELKLAIASSNHGVILPACGEIPWKELANRDSSWRYSNDSGVTWHCCRQEES